MESAAKLKTLSAASLPLALAKAERYRLLNEPTEAESICRDILAVEPANQQAVVMLVLALSDQVADRSRAFQEAMSEVSLLESEYDRAYYTGLLWERRAKARLREGNPGGNHTAYEWLVKAMWLFEEAERLREPGHDDAILRWNTCVRFLAAHPELAPLVEEVPEALQLE